MDNKSGEALAKNARRSVENYSWGKRAQIITKEIESLLDKN
jgi:glycosyltransferase involved in cell wall biosynthesis